MWRAGGGNGCGGQEGEMGVESGRGKWVWRAGGGNGCGEREGEMGVEGGRAEMIVDCRKK